jgi:hypothetical protein
MSFMLEVYYHAPPNQEREARISQETGQLGGRMTYREAPAGDGSRAICLTYEFDDLRSAETAASRLRRLGEHVEGPADYGPEEGAREPN